MALPLPLLTPSLALRPYRSEDWEPVAALMCDAETCRYLAWGPRTLEGAREAFERRLMTPVHAETHYLPLAVTARDSGAYLGEVSLMHLDNPVREAEIGYMLAPEARGRGVATEACCAAMDLGFKRLARHRIFATCDDRNVGSYRVMEKLGMRREAHHIRNGFDKGEWTSALVYAVLAEEWPA